MCKVGRTLYHTMRKVGRTLYHTMRKVGRALYRTMRKVGRTLYRTMRKVGGTLYHTMRKVGRTLYHTMRKVGRTLYRTMRKVGRTLYHTQGWIYPVSHGSLRYKIEVLRCEIECDSQKIAMENDFDRAKLMLFECDFRACMNAWTCGLCSSVRCAIKDLRLYAISFSFICIYESMRGALDSCYFPRMPYACRYLDFRVRRFDNKLHVAFDSVRCWFVEVLLTS